MEIIRVIAFEFGALISACWDKPQEYRIQVNLHILLKGGEKVPNIVYNWGFEKVKLFFN
jgi:hypothetical protein